MSQTHTIVVRFPAGIVPRYSAATELQGGQVVAVDFDGNRLALLQELEEAAERLFELANHFNVSGVYFSESTENFEALKAVEDTLAKVREAKP